MLRRRLRSAFSAVLICAVAACASNQPANDNPPPGMDPLIPHDKGVQGATVRVENQNFQDMVIYVTQGSGGSRQRLGQVTGTSTSVLRIPANLVGNGAQLRFIADPIGGSNTPVSYAISVEPGDEVQLTIPPH